MHHKWNLNREQPLLSTDILLDNHNLCYITSISRFGLLPNDEDRGHSVCVQCLCLIVPIKAKTMSLESAWKKMQNMMMETKVELIKKN